VIKTESRRRSAAEDSWLIPHCGSAGSHKVTPLLFNNPITLPKSSHIRSRRPPAWHVLHASAQIRHPPGWTASSAGAIANISQPSPRSTDGEFQHRFEERTIGFRLFAVEKGNALPAIICGRILTSRKMNSLNNALTLEYIGLPMKDRK